MNLLHVTDPHLFAERDAAHRGIVTAASFAAVLDAAFAARSVDAVIVTGDLCQDESAGGYRICHELLSARGCPVLCLPGNHDDLELMQAQLSGGAVQVLGELELGAWRIIGSDCTVPGAVHGEYGAARLAALASTLAERPDAPTVLALHHPPVRCGSAWLDQSRLRDADALLALLARHPQVRVVLCGHIHQPLDVMHDSGVRVLATPSTCRQFAVHHDGFATDDALPGWRWLQFDDDRLATTVARLVELPVAAEAS